MTVPNTQNPVPSLTSLSPNTANPGGPAFTLTVNGSNFISSSTIQWNGANLATTYVSATQLTTAIPASYIANASNATVTVFTPLPGGGTSNGLSFAVGAPFTIWGNTAPSAGAGWKDPSSLEVGVHFHADVSGYITGVRFYKWSFNTGAHIGNLWTNSGTLLGRATFTGETASGWQSVSFSTPVAISSNTTYVASYFTTTGYAVTTNYFATSSFDNPPLHAPQSVTGTLNGLYLYGATTAFPTQSTNGSNYWVDVLFSVPSSTGTVPNPIPTLSTLSPSSSTINGSGGEGSGVTLTLTGTNFISSSMVQWNGAARSTTFVSSTTLTAAIPITDLSSTGTANVTVFNPTPGGGTSCSQTFTIYIHPSIPEPTLTSVSPSSATAVATLALP